MSNLWKTSFADTRLWEKQLGHKMTQDSGSCSQHYRSVSYTVHNRNSFLARVDRKYIWKRTFHLWNFNSGKFTLKKNTANILNPKTALKFLTIITKMPLSHLPNFRFQNSSEWTANFSTTCSCKCHIFVSLLDSTVDQFRPTARWMCRTESQQQDSVQFYQTQTHSSAS